MYKTLILFLGSMFIFSSCLDDECTSTQEFVRYEAVMVHADEFRISDIEVSEGQPLENPGKLYFYQDYLLINEEAKGIHFYDISDRSTPTEVAFYHISGNFDMAINNNILYADNVVDIIAIDISDIQKPKITQRVEEYKDDWRANDGFYFSHFNLTDQTRVVDCSNDNFNNNFFLEDNVLFIQNSGSREILSSATDGGSGVGGSFARFTIAKNHLYTVDEWKLNSWRIDNGEISLANINELNWGIETIFPYGDNLFIGSNRGMFIFDNSDPARPSLLSTFEHANACDPVVVKDNIAYVTLRSGNICEGFVNQMDVVDVSDLRNPSLIKSYNMVNPHGLSIQDNNIILGEGEYGLKILNAENPTDIKEREFYQDIITYDVITLSNNDVFIVGDGGFYLGKIIDEKITVVSSILVQE